MFEQKQVTLNEDFKTRKIGEFEIKAFLL